MMTASAYWSVLPSEARSAACSGAAYAGVPANRQSSCRLNSRARPRSRILKSRCSVARMFSGFKSRCTIMPRVGKVERLSERTDDQADLVERQLSAPLDQLAKRFAFDELEDRERVVVMEAEVEDRGDRRVRQTGAEPGFLGER